MHPLKILGILCLFVLSVNGYGQHTNELIAKIDVENQLLNIQQTFTYQNNSTDTLNILYFNDWNHSYASKNSSLAKRFSEDYKKSLHLAANINRGATKLIGLIDSNYDKLAWERLSTYDIIKVVLNQPILPNESVKYIFTYTVKIPASKFTGYGFTQKGDYYLRDWYLSPAVYKNSEWLLYSNKDLQDLYTGISNTIINFVYPENYSLNTNYKEIKSRVIDGNQWVKLVGNRKKGAEIYLTHENNFKRFQVNNTVLVTDIIDPKLSDSLSVRSVNKVFKYLQKSLGSYPHDQLLVTKQNYNRNPLYGLNQLPSFVRPYTDSFKLELSLLKTSLYTIFNESFFINPRKDQWIVDGLVNYLMIRFVEQQYPDQKLLGKLSDTWLLKRFHLADLNFNDQYALLYNVSARKNLNQALTTSNDSLIKFNQQVANKYKAGLGIAYLANYLEKGLVDSSIRYFYNTYNKSEVSADLFREIIAAHTHRDISWFFDEYINSNHQINFTISKAKIHGDEALIELKGNKHSSLPISLFGVKNDTVVFKRWVDGVSDQKTFKLPSLGADRLVLNYDQKIPEINQRDNWKSLKGMFSSNRKFKMQFFKDVENPYYNQLFYVPVATLNIYDGFTPGLRLHNKTVTEKPFLFDISPSYGLSSKTFVGYGNMNYKKYFEDQKLYVMNFRLSASSFHFTESARYTTFSPSIVMGWRPSNLRSNKLDSFLVRYIRVDREYEKAPEIIPNTPNYGIFNMRFQSINKDALNYFEWNINSEWADKFAKLSVGMEYRKLFDNKQQFNVRFFAGKFIANHTTDNYFSFALDRPTDYLFEYNYLGRSEEKGVFSQQLIIADGGFKSKLENPHANSWMATINSSLNVWRWVELYSDVGFIKNRGRNQLLVYDFGARLNLVTDYFELYFPMYSNNGWEVSDASYASKIRFIVTLSPKTLTGLFKRRWF